MHVLHTISSNSKNRAFKERMIKWKAVIGYRQWQKLEANCKGSNNWKILSEVAKL